MEELTLGVAQGLHGKGLEILCDTVFCIPEKLLFFGEPALLGLREDLELGLSPESCRFTVTELPDVGFKAGAASLQVRN